MDEFNISDYGIFENAISSTRSVKNYIDACNDAIKQGQSILADETIFMGPICESCVDGFSKVSNSFIILNDNFATISNYFIDVSSTYKEGDEEASIKVLTLGKDGKMSSSTMSNYNGTPIYYSQKGYVDENGQFHTWPTKWGKTIASSGCGPTSLASILATMFGDNSITPSTIADTMSYDANIGGSFVGPVCQQYGLDQDCHIGLGQDNVNTFLRNNGKLLVAVREGGHYIAVLGINDSTQPPTYIVNDPIDDNTANKTWTFQNITAGHTMAFYIAPQGSTVDECLNRTAVSL